MLATRWVQTPSQVFSHTYSYWSHKVPMISLPHVSRPRRAKRRGWYSLGHELGLSVLYYLTLTLEPRRGEFRSHPAQSLSSCVWPWTSPRSSVSLGFCRDWCIVPRPRWCGPCQLPGSPTLRARTPAGSQRAGSTLPCPPGSSGPLFRTRASIH